MDVNVEQVLAMQVLNEEKDLEDQMLPVTKSLFSRRG